VSSRELENKVAAFFDLLDEWRRAENAEFFRLYWIPRLLNSRGYPGFLYARVSASGGWCGGGRRGYLPFT
jgi:hypothetical protein